jgi:hypothetical protein
MWRIVGEAAAAPAATVTNATGAPMINQMMLRRMVQMLQQFRECRWLAVSTAASHFRMRANSLLKASLATREARNSSGHTLGGVAGD